MMWLPHLSWGRLVGSLILALATLQVLHMVLLSRLDTRRTEHKQHRLMRRLKEDTSSLYISIRDRLESTRILDSSGQYSIVNFLYRGKDHSAEMQGQGKVSDITLVSQCSVHLMHHLVELCDSWQGPVSISVFATDIQVPTVVEILLKLYQCLPTFQKYASIHLVLPLTPSRGYLPDKSHDSPDAVCSEVEKEVLDLINKRTLSAQNYVLGKVQYPNNLLRNIAMKNSVTEYTMVIDIDMVPSPNLRQNLLQFFHKGKQHDNTLSSQQDTVFIVPAFEIQREVTIPRDKEELLKLWEKHLVRPFYFESCWKCQRHTDYEAWKELPRRDAEDRNLKVAYEVEWKDPWEPFFVGPSSMPMYDERFRQYGFNRISQVCELHVAGYTFGVLDEAFLAHRGFKTQDSFHFNKESEQDHNRNLFRQFKEELKAKYPESERRCY